MKRGAVLGLLLLAGCGPAHFIGESFKGPQYRARYHPGDDAGKPSLTVTGPLHPVLAPLNPNTPAGPFMFIASTSGIPMCPRVECELDARGQVIADGCVEPIKPNGCCDQIEWTFQDSGKTEMECHEYQSLQRALNCRGACEVVVRLYDPRHEVITASSVTVQISGAGEQEEGAAE